MDYRKELMEMIENIKREDILEYLFVITKDIVKEDK